MKIFKEIYLFWNDSKEKHPMLLKKLEEKVGVPNTKNMISCNEIVWRKVNEEQRQYNLRITAKDRGRCDVESKNCALLKRYWILIVT